MTSPPDPASLIRELYRHEYGYVLSPADEARVLASHSSPVYGELVPSATDRLARELQLGPDDTFYDLGSGLGKVVLQLAMSLPLRGCFGVELARRRHRIAARMLERVRADGLLRTTNCGFRCADLMATRLDDATVVYTCSTAFSPDFLSGLTLRLSQLRVGLRWVSTRKVAPNPWFEHESATLLDMTWQRQSQVNVYRLHTQRP